MATWMEGANQTQHNFSRRCPVVSHARSSVEANLLDRGDDAEKTREEYQEHLEETVAANAVVALPVVAMAVAPKTTASAILSSILSSM